MLSLHCYILTLDVVQVVKHEKSHTEDLLCSLPKGLKPGRVPEKCTPLSVVATSPVNCYPWNNVLAQ